MRPAARLAAILILSAGCGDVQHGTPDGDPDGGPVTSCDPPGHFGVPATSFVLPPRGTGFPYDDVQAAFPDVDWATLDRLYLPAGQYTHIQLGNLPRRDPARPLVITNQGGQVVIGFNPTGNYIWSFGGGANWVLTGRYDELSQTGDAAFPGHACGHYDGAKYGIVSDDNFALSAPYLHMGIAVGGGATDFEIEYVEVTRSGFAGIRLLNSPSEGVDKPMANVRVHDTYVHDVAGEGFYFGWTGGAPSNKFPGLQIYNNRILRTGNEALQIQDVGDGSRIHHNTFISGGLHWLDNGLGRYQDNLSQISVREGEIELDHNVFIDGAGALVSFFSQPQTGDGDRHVTFHDNYFAGALSIGSYLGGTSAAGSSFTFASNTFRDAIFGYTPVDPTATDPGHWLAPGAEFRAPIVLQGNHWQAGKQLIRGLDGGDGTVGSATASGNIAGEPAAIELRDHWHRPGHHLTAWAEKATVAPGSPTVTYRAGDLVMHGARPDFYEATAEISGAAPGTSPAWSMMVPPGDDVRVVEGTAYAELGVR